MLQSTWNLPVVFCLDDVLRELGVWFPASHQTNCQVELEKEASTLLPLYLPLLPWKFPLVAEGPPFPQDPAYYTLVSRSCLMPLSYYTNCITKQDASSHDQGSLLTIPFIFLNWCFSKEDVDKTSYDRMATVEWLYHVESVILCIRHYIIANY